MAITKVKEIRLNKSEIIAALKAAIIAKNPDLEDEEFEINVFSKNIITESYDCLAYFL